jgi:hypothetical protein
MIRPYLAILKDAVREAMASRVLWFTSGLVLLLLALLAPIGYQVQPATELAFAELVDALGLLEQLQADHARGTPSPGQRIWELLAPQERQRLIQLAKDAARDGRGAVRLHQALREALNGLIRRPDLYDPAAWDHEALPREAQQLLARPTAARSAVEQARLNRLLLQTSFDRHVRSRGGQSVQVTYGRLASDPLPFSKRQLDELLAQWLLPTVVGWIVGGFGMVAAILVTSGMIPQMFDPGSIALLLSKPLSRSGLLITKFLGGCAFVLINVTLLLGGLWLIAGWRLDCWNAGLWTCIPVFLFMFLVYYAVSALAGVVWKSPVISVGLTIFFWLVCFAIDLSHDLLNDLAVRPQRIRQIAAAEDTLLTRTESGVLQLWDATQQDWQVLRVPGRAGRNLPLTGGLVYHAPTQSLLLVEGLQTPLGPLGRMTLYVARAEDAWRPKEGPLLPSSTVGLVLTSDQQVLAYGQEGLFRLQGSPTSTGRSLSLLGLNVPLGGGAEFRPCLSEPRVSWETPLAAAADPREKKVVVASGNRVLLWVEDGQGRFVRHAQHTLPGPRPKRLSVALAGPNVLVAGEQGPLWRLSSDDLAVRQSVPLPATAELQQIAIRPDGLAAALLFDDGRLWRLDGTSGGPMQPRQVRAGQVTALAWTDDALWVAEEPQRVRACDGPGEAVQAEYAPPLARTQWLFHYVVRPLHLLSPKPRQLQQTVQYLLTGNESTTLPFPVADSNRPTRPRDPWAPVRSGLVFIVVALTAACLYLERHEF